MKNLLYFFLLTLLILIPFQRIYSSGLTDRVAGRIFLQVESRGEAWYVDAGGKWRSFLGRPKDAWNIMREQGIGISNKDLEKIPIGILAGGNSDYDQDGLSDDLEKAIGTSFLKSDTDNDGFSDYAEIKGSFNPLGQGNANLDLPFVRAQQGKILLQVESRGEAWYVYPVDGRRYFLGRPEDAFAVMRSLGIGISNADLNKINSLTPNFLLSAFAEDIYSRVNAERVKAGAKELKWNDELARVAEEYASDLAAENSNLTGLGSSCDMPFIHHEGLTFGLTASERMNNRGVYYFNKAGENIALMAAASYKVVIDYGDSAEADMLKCQNKRAAWDSEYKNEINSTEDSSEKIEIIKNEIERRKIEFNQSRVFDISEIEWFGMDKIAENTIQGWLASPGHKENMLNSEYTETGIGAAYINGYIITTQIFITRVYCGFKQGQCCQEAGYYPYCYLPLHCQDNQCL